MKRKILVVDDEPTICLSFKRYLSEFNYEVQDVASLAAAREMISQAIFDGAIIDQNLPDGKGVDLIADLRAMYPDIAIVIITGMGDFPLAVEAMRRGADNFLIKPVNLEDLEVFLRKSMEVGSLRRKVRSREILEKKNPPEFGTSAAAVSVMDMAHLAATNDSPVLISGETGIGKGVLAQWIHANSSRNAGVIVDVNCSCLRGELLASELFGHTKGAYTSADQDREGLLDIADHGTLFLDEIGDMDIAIQGQFLKVVEEKAYRRLGETRTRRSDFRLICATNKDLVKEAAAGRFRRDLLFRIQVLPIRIPSLWERPSDIPGLLTNILSTLNYREHRVAPEVIALLEAHAWPGNIRELKNVIEYAVLRSGGGPLLVEHFSNLSPQTPAESAGGSGELNLMVEESIRTALIRYEGDVIKAARSLGISRATVYRKLKKLRETIQ